MNKALLDTDTLSEIGKGKNAAIAANAKTYRRSFGHYSFSTITVLEIVRGYQKAQQFQRLNAFMASIVSEEVFPSRYCRRRTGGPHHRRPRAHRPAHRPGGPDDRRHRHR